MVQQGPTHELCAPIQGIIGAVESVLASSLEADARLQLEAALRDAYRALALAEEVAPAPQLPAPRPSGLRILVAEDNAVNQKVVMGILRKRGYEIMLAVNGHEALEALRLAPAPDYYAIVLMDVQMPVMDGLSATRAIRRDPRWANLPIVAMTAHAMTGDRDRCLEAGMSGYVSKPVNPAHLVATIERYTRSRDARIAPAAASRASGIVVSNENGTAEGMLHLFLELAPGRLGALAAAVARGDTQETARRAGRLSAAARRVDAPAIAAAATSIAKEGHGDVAALEEMVHALAARQPRR